MSPMKPQATDLNALRQMLARSPRAFSLNLAVCNNPTLRDELIGRLQDEFQSVDIVSVASPATDIFEEIREDTTAGPLDALFVVDIEEALAAEGPDGDVIQALNRSPRRWKAWYPYPVIFWMSSAGADRLAREAKDFWEWQTKLFRLEG